MTGRLAGMRHPLSMIGIALTTAGAVLFIVLFLLELLGFLTNPYAGLLVFVTLPAAFILGLLLIPVGVYLERRGGRAAAQWPRVDLNQPAQRRVVLFIALATLANIVLLSMASYGAVHYMESNAFCGQVCHAPMEPQFAAYQVAPHARVACVNCHVGAGATYFARSKMSGTRQLAAVLTDSYERPIPTPVRNLRPARDTCEQCHWPEKFHGDRIRRIHEYADDEENSETVTTLRLHVGGGSEKLGVATGIHWHMNLGNEIEYVATDDRRQVIPYVRLRDRSGKVTEYRTPGVADEEIAGGERRLMDCMDCHSRPSHTFAPTPERAVDGALALGTVDRGLPFVRREMVAALKGEYPTQEAGAEAIARRLQEFYRTQAAGADEAAVARAIVAAQALYRQNVFPSMNVRWGTYPNELGHTDSPGCFRCHDDNHQAPDGSVIRQDCDICHSIE